MAKKVTQLFTNYADAVNGTASHGSCERIFYDLTLAVQVLCDDAQRVREWTHNGVFVEWDEYDYEGDC